MSKDDPFSNFLYPFLDNQESGTLTGVLAEVRDSTLQKAAEVSQMRQAFFAEQGEELVVAAQAMSARFFQGGQLLTMGNGGSATDAQDMVADLLNPKAGQTPLPALSLTNDIGVVTAVGNDVGFENVYTRQVIAYGRPQDMLVGFSTSGASKNLLVAFEQAQKTGLLTIGITGYDGGQIAKQDLDHCFVVRSSYVPRIQEVHATIYHTLLTLTQEIMHDKKELLDQGSNL